MNEKGKEEECDFTVVLQQPTPGPSSPLTPSTPNSRAGRRLGSIDNPIVIEEESDGVGEDDDVIILLSRPVYKKREGKRSTRNRVLSPPPSTSTSTTIRTLNKVQTSHKDRSASSSHAPITCHLPTPPPSESPSSPISVRLTYTSIERPIPSIRDLPFDFHSYTGKHLGLRANRDIKRGELIIKEEPFFTLPIGDIDEDITSDHILPLLPLSQDCQGLFHSFTGRTDRHADNDHYVNIIETNSIPLISKDSQALGLFRHICRVNHSCTPNSGWSWVEDEGNLHLYAYTNIDCGEEITASYLPQKGITLSYAQRQRHLLNGHGFVCLCDACATSAIQIVEADTSLALFEYLQDEWMETDLGEYAADIHDALRKLNQAKSILLSNDKFNAVGDVLEQLYDVYAIHGMLKRSKDAALQCLDHFTVCLGKKAAEQSRYAALAMDPTLFERWAELDSSRERKKRKRRREDKAVRMSIRIRRSYEDTFASD
ncbi:hypothetical protein CI109_104572 [Kwoniella shandongensis]|uniref:Uncharacterized protein n=1 Tax=Kwoniella shandongensis TaxID=1734106 RepID=A0A5M6BTD1_9TREE|nr:uncharacterized protein CI109_005538 [Kwoniella shandongensis]KAA5526104.1 hypothetical protein CI109_005538 [Kwoniella shandongensis]